MAFEYRSGRRILQLMPLDKDSADTVAGLALTEAGATAGYVKEVDAAAEAVVGIAVSVVAVTGASDGDHSVLVDVSTESIYEVGPDAGSIAQSINNNTLDVGATGLTIDIDGSSTDDIEVVRVDVTANKAWVRIKRSALGGVA